MTDPEEIDKFDWLYPDILTRSQLIDILKKVLIHDVVKSFVVGV